MELQILGCSGGIGNGLRTTSFLVDDDVLIDAGSGVGHLTLESVEKIKHIFLTHSHLDHVHSIPLLVDSIFDRIREPIEIHALPETIHALQEHVFNWVIWPDFSRLPHPDKPVLRFSPMQPGETRVVKGRTFEMVAVNHVVPAVGYYVSTSEGAFAFTGDTTTNDSFWDFLNKKDRLDLLVSEIAFANSEIELCRRSRHYCPTLLAADLKKLRHKPPIYLSHAKPGAEKQIGLEFSAIETEREHHQLTGGEIFTI